VGVDGVFPKKDAEIPTKKINATAISPPIITTTIAKIIDNRMPLWRTSW